MMEPNTEQLQLVIQSSDMIEELASLHELINDPTLGVEIEPLKIYCQKTGHIVGARDQNSLFSLIKIKGKNAIIPSLYNATTLSVHPAWIETSGENLDRLINDDPIGYAVYCFGLITSGFYQNAKNTDKKKYPWIERYWALARANALLTQRGIAGLDALNIELCKLLTYAPDTQSYLFKRAREMAKTPDMLAMLHCSGELTELLRDCTNRYLAAIQSHEYYIHKTRFVDYAATPADAARGPSNIRQQKASKRDIKEASEFAELTKLFGDAGLDIREMMRANTPGTNAWKARLASNTKAEMLADLIEIGGTNLDNVFDAVEVEDNEVEINRLSIQSDKDHRDETLQNQDQNEQYTIEYANNSQFPVGNMNYGNVKLNNNNIIEELPSIKEIPIRPIMGQIAKAVMENVVKDKRNWNEIIQQEIAPVLVAKPLSALERLRAKKGQK